MVGRRPWPTLTGLGVVLATAAVVLLGSGVAAPDVARWLLVVLLGVMAPGFVVVRAVRGADTVAEDRAAAAWARGERWVLADRAAGPVSSDLSSIGTVLVDRDGVVLVRLTEQPPPG